MRNIKSFKLFEAIHPVNTNIDKLDPNFVEDITDICINLFDDLNIFKEETYVSFLSPLFRQKCDELDTDYPSIQINLPILYGSDGYTYSEVESALLQIKKYLGDSYISCGCSRYGKYHRVFLESKYNWDFKGHSYQVVYDPKNFEI